MSLELKHVDNGNRESVALSDCAPGASSLSTISTQVRSRWAHSEGLPLPLGASWIEEEQAFNFALCAEHAESVALAPLFPRRFGEPNSDVSL